MGVFIQLSGGLGGPDGLAIDSAGNLSVASSPAPALATTNLAYGGKDNKVLYITESESGSVLTVPLEVAGNPMYSHR